jgi:hypothetical protein
MVTRESVPYCIHCGERLSAGARFCNRCGATVAAVGSPLPDRSMLPSNVEARPVVGSTVLPSNVQTRAQRQGAQIHAPSSGSHLGVIGSLAALVAFFMPWVSCGPVSVSGMDAATGADGSSGSLVLLLLPLIAVALLALAGLRYAPRTRRRDQELRTQQVLVGTGGSLLSVLVVLSVLWQRAHLPFGSGAFIKIELGLWLEACGFIIATLGGLAGYTEDA